MSLPGFHAGVGLYRVRVRAEAGQSDIGSPKAEQSGFSHIDGSPIASGGSALTPQCGQMGETSSWSMSSQRSLMTSVWPR